MWCKDSRIDTRKARARFIDLVGRQWMETQKMSGRNFDKLRTRAAMHKRGTETVNGDMEAGALARFTEAPRQPRVPKAALHAKASDATAVFLANGGAIKTIPARKR